MSIAQLKGIDLTTRDMELLRGLFESRVMTVRHASALYFDGQLPMARKRVQRLKEVGLIRERPRNHVSHPSVLFIGRKGLDILHTQGHLGDYPEISLTQLEKRAQVSERTLAHELEVMDVKAAMVPAINALPNFHVEEFSTWPLLYEFSAYRPDGERVLVKPDGFIRVHEKEPDGSTSEHAFFLEVDRSTEKAEILCRRAACYLDYYRNGGFAKRCGGQLEQYGDFPFRVLCVFKSTARCESLATKMIEGIVPIRTLVWLTTKQSLTANPCADIWDIPLNYTTPHFYDAVKIKPAPLFE